MSIATYDDPKRAALYDRWFDEPWGRYASGVEGRAIRRALPRNAQRTIDIGCGTGRFAPYLQIEGAILVGLDSDRAMLALAAPRIGGLVQGVAESLPFASGTFDISVAVTVLEFVRDPAGVVAEMIRVTRPGGRVIVGTLNPRSPWGVANRDRLRTGVWCDATFISRRDLRTIGEHFGPTSVRSALYAPGWFPGIDSLGPVLEAVGRLFPWWGAFQVTSIAH